MCSPSPQILQFMRLRVSFFTGTVALLELLTSAFTLLLQDPVGRVSSPPLRSFMLSIYCIMMMLCSLALCVDVSLCSAGLNSSSRRCSEILRIVTVLTGSMAIISLLFISKPFIASVFLLVWLLLAIYLILSLYRNLTQPILPITINTTSNSISAAFNSVNALPSMMKNWIRNLFHQ